MITKTYALEVKVQVIALLLPVLDRNPDSCKGSPVWHRHKGYTISLAGDQVDDGMQMNPMDLGRALAQALRRVGPLCQPIQGLA